MNSNYTTNHTIITSKTSDPSISCSENTVISNITNDSVTICVDPNTSVKPCTLVQVTCTLPVPCNGPYHPEEVCIGL